MCPILAFLASVLGVFERDVNLIYVMYMFILRVSTACLYLRIRSELTLAMEVCTCYFADWCICLDLSVYSCIAPEPSRKKNWLHLLYH